MRAQLAQMWTRFLVIAGLAELTVWTLLVPYLVWQQWSKWLALGLLTWWFIGYWPLAIKSIRSFLAIRRQLANMEAALQHMVESTDPDAQQIIPDGWDESGPSFSKN